MNRGGRGGRDGGSGRGGRGGGGPKRESRFDRSRSRSPHGGRRSMGGNDRMVFISNISYEMRWLELKTLVQERGGEVNFIELLEDREGRPKGNAVVEFKDKQSAVRCCESLHKYDIHGRLLKVIEIRDPVAFFRKVQDEVGKDFLAKIGGVSGITGVDESRPMRTGTYDLFGLSPEFLRQNHIDPPLCQRVFVANLAYNVGTTKIYEVFGLAGVIQWMDLHQDKEGRHKGVCVLEYSHPLEAVQAISMFHGQKLYDRILAVKMDRFEKTENVDPNRIPRGLESIGMGLGTDGAPLKEVAKVAAGLRGNAPAQEPVQSLMGGVGNMGGGSMTTSAYDRGNFGGTAAALSGNGGMATGGTGWPVAAQPQQAAVGSFATSFSGGVGGGGGYSTGGGFSTGTGTGGYANAGGVGGVSNAFAGGAFGGGDRSVSAVPLDGFAKKDSNAFANNYPVTRVVMIKNLPTDYSWQIVRDRMMQFGEIESVDMLAPGVARIRFIRTSDAERMRTALSGTSVEGRPIDVEYL